MSVRANAWCWIVAWLVVIPIVRADEEALRRRLTDLLETSWDSGDEAKSQADKQFAAIDKTAGSDPRAHYARALVLLKQRRYDEAGKSLDYVVKFDPEFLPGWRAKIWLALLTKHYGVALGGMESLAEQVAKLPDDDENRITVEETTRFLGTVYGYVDGPLSEVAAVASRKSTEKVISAVLNAEQRIAFKEARQDVLERYLELTTEKQDSREQAIADDEAEKQKVLADVEKRRDEIANQAETLKERQAKLEGELKDELNEVARLDRPLLAQLTTLQSQGTLIQANLDSVLIDIQRLEAFLAIEKDPNRRDQLLFDLSRLGPILRRYEGELVAISGAISGVQARRGTLATRQATAQRNLGGQLQSIERQFNAFRSEERRLAGTEKRAKKPSSGSTGKVNGLSMTAAALKTYEPFPIEQERLRLLTDLK